MNGIIDDSINNKKQCELYSAVEEFSFTSSIVFYVSLHSNDLQNKIQLYKDCFHCY